MSVPTLIANTTKAVVATFATAVTHAVATTHAASSGESSSGGGAIDVAHEVEEKVTGIDLRFFTSSQMDVAYFICVLIATLITFKDVKNHVDNFNFPKIQVYIVRVVMMVPVYGVFSFASINMPSMRFFLDTVRDTYEAIVLYMFFMMLIAYGGGEGALIKALNKKKYKGIHPTPLCCLPLFNLDQSFFLRCKRMVLQYAIWKPCASLVACLLEPIGYYRETDFNWDNAYLYIYMGYNVSLSYSLYYLVLFEIETEKELRYCKAAMKFLCIKSLIFFAFWQSMLLSMLISAGVIYTGPEEESEHVTTAIMNGLICLELLPVSFLHHYAFSREKLGWEMAAQPVFNIETEEMSAKQGLDLALTFDGVAEDLIATVFYRKGKLLDYENDDGEEEFGGAAGGDSDLMHGSSRHHHPRVHHHMGVEDGSGGHHGSGGVADPTVEELVQFAFNNDRGIRPEGLLWVPDSSDDDLYDDKVEYQDTDIIDPNFSVKTAVGTTRSDAVALENAIAHAALDMVLTTDIGVVGKAKQLKKAAAKAKKQQERGGGAGGSSISSPVILREGDGGIISSDEGGEEMNDTGGHGGGNGADILVFCSVCGRYDRELVKRKETYKCVECVGSKSMKELKAANRMFVGVLNKTVEKVVDVSKKGVEGITLGAVDLTAEPEFKFKDERPMEREDIH